jgi:hypothetical protein
MRVALCALPLGPGALKPNVSATLFRVVSAMKVFRSIDEPIRNTGTWDERWKGPDQGLVACWERGREKRREDPALAGQADAGALVVLPWKGGVDKATKKGEKYGTLYYLAMWQGLRNEDLNIDPANDRALVCSATGMTVIFTGDLAKYGKA